MSSPLLVSSSTRRKENKEGERPSSARRKENKEGENSSSARRKENKEEGETHKEHAFKKKLFAILKEGKTLPETFLYSISHLPESVQKYFHDSKKNHDFYEKSARIILTHFNAVGEGSILLRRMAIFFITLVIIVGLLIWVGIVGVMRKKEAWIDFIGLKLFSTPKFSKDVIDKTQATSKSVLDMTIASTQTAANLSQETAKELITYVLDAIQVGNTIKTVMLIKFAAISSKIIYYKFVKKESKFELIISNIEMFLYFIVLAVLLNVYVIYKDSIRQREYIAIGAFIILMFLTNTMAELFYRKFIEYTINPDNSFVEAEKMILPKNWAQSTKDRESFMKLRRELEKACIDTKCGITTRSKQYAEVYFTPKAGQKPKVESIRELMMEGGNYISKGFLWIFRSMSLFFIRGSKKHEEELKHPKSRELESILRDDYERLEKLEQKSVLEE
jgi:hypothetical protein